MAPGSIAARQQAIYNMGYQPGPGPGGTGKERGYTMQQLRRKIIELINNIDSLEKLKIIYQFIRGLLSS